MSALVRDEVRRLDPATDLAGYEGAVLAIAMAVWSGASELLHEHQAGGPTGLPDNPAGLDAMIKQDAAIGWDD